MNVNDQPSADTTPKTPDSSKKSGSRKASEVANEVLTRAVGGDKASITLKSLNSNGSYTP